MTVTDAEGCSQTVDRRIYVEDVEWYGEKVKICHNGQSKKVSYNAVAAHLAHGDQLGYCRSGCKGCPDPEEENGTAKGLNVLAENNQLQSEGLLKVYPNPNSGSFTVELPKSVK